MYVLIARLQKNYSLQPREKYKFALPKESAKGHFSALRATKYEKRSLGYNGNRNKETQVGVQSTYKAFA